MGNAQESSLKPVVGLSVWTAAELRADNSWLHRLTTIELAELHNATLDASARKQQPQQLEQADFSFPVLSSVIRRIRHELDTGRGLFLFRGLNVKDYSLNQLTMLHSGLTLQLGGIFVPQNLTGELICSVTDHSEAQLNEPQARGHRGRAEMLPHNDSADIVSLLCVCAAKRGGTTSVCSSASVHNEIFRRNPTHLTPLRRGFYFDLTGKTEAGVSQHRLPVFYYEEDRVVCQFNRSRIECGMRKAGMPLSTAEIAALDDLGDLAQHPIFALRLQLRPGDILFLDNARVLHARDAYADWTAPDRKRLLLRLWLTRQVGARLESE